MSTSPSTACRTCASASRAGSSRRRRPPVSFNTTSSVAASARAERAAAARETQATAPEDEGQGIGTTHPNLDEAALLLAAALFDVKHQLESWRTRPFRYRPKGRTDRVDIATELQGELNLWIADWLEWDSLLDSVERVDPSLIAVRPHVPAHAERSGGVDAAAIREPEAGSGRSQQNAAVMRRGGGRPHSGTRRIAGTPIPHPKRAFPRAIPRHDPSLRGPDPREVRPGGGDPYSRMSAT